MQIQTHDLREMQAASCDAVLLAMGHEVDRPHPLARVMSSDGALSEAALAAGIVAYSARPQYKPLTRAMAISAGLGSSDFAATLAEAGSRVTYAIYAQQAQHLKFCTKITANNFKPFDVPAVGLDVVPKHLGPGAEVLEGTAETVGGATGVRLSVYGRTLGISEKVVINNDALQVERIFSAFGAASARLEAQLVASTLETPALLDDGQAVFHTNFGNVLAEAFSETALGAAMALLRKQLAPGGQRADLQMRHLVVDPDNEAAARKVVRDGGYEIEVITMADLPAGRWFALADQAVAPTVAVIRLADSPKPVRVVRLKSRIEFDGICVKGTADLGATILGRVGIVRGGA